MSPVMPRPVGPTTAWYGSVTTTASFPRRRMQVRPYQVISTPRFSHARLHTRLPVAWPGVVADVGAWLLVSGGQTAVRPERPSAGSHARRPGAPQRAHPQVRKRGADRPTPQTGPITAAKRETGGACPIGA